ncbi:hypothetical protein pb186bvf_013724 [Paramecium bursaria]
MKLISKFSLIQNRLNQISSRSLAITFKQDQLQHSDINNLTYLVPTFFADHEFTIKELKPEYLFANIKFRYKVTPSDRTYNTPSNSYLQLFVPLGSNKRLRSQFTRLNTNFLRIGRLLELLDALTGMTAYRYCYTDFNTDRDNTIATQGVYNLLFFVDEFSKFLYHSKAKDDIYINSYATYAGKSSLEINADIFQNDLIAATVQFVMVSRNAKDYLKSSPVPQLQFLLENDSIKEQCILRAEMGKVNQQKRIQEAKQQREPPDVAESRFLHEFILKNSKGVIKTMGSTKLEKNSLVQFQNQNLHGFAFGGHVMKEIIELGYLVGYKHSKGVQIRILHVFDIQFIAPVPIGSCVAYTSQVVYVDNEIMIIQVQVDVHTFQKEGEQIKKTTEVFMAMKSNELLDPITPITYEEGLFYLHGRRLLNLSKSFPVKIYSI